MHRWRVAVEELIHDRQSLQQAVQSAASGDLEPTSLTIASFTIGAINGQEPDGWHARSAAAMAKPAAGPSGP